MVKCLPAMWETWVWSLGQKDLLEKEMVTHPSTLAWEIPWMEEPGRLQSMVTKSQTWLSNFTFFSFYCKVVFKSQGLIRLSFRFWARMCLRLLLCSCQVSPLTLSDPMDCSTPAYQALTTSQSLPKFMAIETVMPSNRLILCHPLVLPSDFSSVRVFSSEPALCIW